MSSLSQKLEVANNLGSNNKYSDFKSNVGSSVNLTSTIYTSNKSTENIQITCSTSNSSIYYTLDESNPDQTSNLYTSQFSVNTPSVIMARSFREGWDPSDISELNIDLSRLPDPVFVQAVNKKTGEVTNYIGIQNWDKFPSNTSVKLLLRSDLWLDDCFVSSEKYIPNVIMWKFTFTHTPADYETFAQVSFECEGYQSLTVTLPELSTN